MGALGVATGLAASGEGTGRPPREAPELASPASGHCREPARRLVAAMTGEAPGCWAPREWGGDQVTTPKVEAGALSCHHGRRRVEAAGR
uniref:Uncharacterized protein n=1 Tax=Oryza sativa subsp. japonica TaxID=39947 RepID=Q53PS6_ORYSJ|nr:hypothetical protein LOC_Os11g17860 [Oryza sativa Japonica Group]